MIKTNLNNFSVSLSSYSIKKELEYERLNTGDSSVSVLNYISITLDYCAYLEKMKRRETLRNKNNGK